MGNGKRLDRQLYYVVGDAGLNSGNGKYVKTLEALKSNIQKYKLPNNWTLVLSIHGSEDVLATQGGFLRNRNAAGAYDAAKIKTIFLQDKDYVKWRDKWGPNWFVLNACQVNAPFEKVLIEAFTKTGSKQPPQGLGKGCRPGTEILYDFDYEFTKFDRRSRKDVTTTKTIRVRRRNDWKKMTRDQRAVFLGILKKVNKKYGYFGAPPVPEDKILHYYFDEEPKGGWPMVEVTHNRKSTGISFQKRTQNAQFLGKLCPAHIGPLRKRKSQAPPAASPRRQRQRR